MFDAYKDRVEFVLVYIREAHALDGHLPMTYGMVEDPIDDAERVAVAKRCINELELVIPTVVDRIDDKVNSAYAGWPERLFLVGKDGKLTYSGGPGPFGFEPDELEAAIRTELAKSATPSADPMTKPKTKPKTQTGKKPRDSK